MAILSILHLEEAPTTPQKDAFVMSNNTKLYGLGPLHVVYVGLTFFPLTTYMWLLLTGLQYLNTKQNNMPPTMQSKNETPTIL